MYNISEMIYGLVFASSDSLYYFINRMIAVIFLIYRKEGLGYDYAERDC